MPSKFALNKSLHRSAMEMFYCQKNDGAKIPSKGHGRHNLVRIKQSVHESCMKILFLTLKSRCQALEEDPGSKYRYIHTVTPHCDCRLDHGDHRLHVWQAISGLQICGQRITSKLNWLCLVFIALWHCLREERRKLLSRQVVQGKHERTQSRELLVL